jgi:hypothetical protein
MYRKEARVTHVIALLVQCIAIYRLDGTDGSRPRVAAQLSVLFSDLVA